MEKKKFEAMLMLLIPQVIHLIAESYQYDEVTAAKEFYYGIMFIPVLKHCIQLEKSIL